MNKTISRIPRSEAQKVQPKAYYVAQSDANLVVASQKGDKQALEQLLTRHQRTVRHIIYQVAPRWQDSADLAQDACIRVIQSIHQLKNPHAFQTWLRHIITNLFYDQLRKGAHGSRFISLDQPMKVDSDTSDRLTRELTDSAPVPEDSVVYSELSDKIGDAINSLPENFRKVVLFRDVEGLRYDEIAVLTNSEIGTVKSRIARGRAKIQVRLARYLQECA